MIGGYLTVEPVAEGGTMVRITVARKTVATNE
jgi:hypothetical protein